MDGFRTPQQVFQALDALDKKEVEASCFQGGRFNPEGEIDCPGHDMGLQKMNSCEEEYLCEVGATLLLMPNDTGLTPDDEAAIWDVEPWVVRFRRALLNGVPIPEGQGRMF